MIDTILTVMEGMSTAHDFYGRVSGILKGDKDKTDVYLAEMIKHLEGIHVHFERLADGILYTPILHSVMDATKPQQQIVTDLREIRERLELVQRALGEDIVSSAMIETPDKMRNALDKSPWEVLIDIRPAHLAIKPNNPDFVQGYLIKI